MSIDEHDLLRSIVDSSTDGIIVKHRDGRYVLCNRAAADILGRTPEQIIGLGDQDLFEHPSAPARSELDQRIIASGIGEVHEQRTDLGGTYRLMQVRKEPYRDRTGEVVAIIITLRDITSRERAAAELQQSDSLLRLVIEALPVGVIVMNRSGDAVLRNAASQRIWGRIIQRADERYRQSRAWWHATGEALQPHEWASVRALVDGVECLDQIVDIEAFDGARRTMRNSAVPIYLEHAIDGAVVLNEDITERLQLESQLAQAQKMEAVGRLAGGIAHDFNNLLMVIQGYTELIETATEPNDPRRADLDEIRRAADSAAGLTRQLLAFGRRDVATPQHVVVEDVIQVTTKMLTRVIGGHIRLVARLAEPRHSVWIDPVQLEQIIVNLALNARDAMEAGGEITISTSSGGDHRSVVLEVRDTGTGMDAEVQARAFEPYFTTKGRSWGTGLGLATVHSLVARSGGTIEVSSVLGQGTTFTIVLPSTAPPATMQPASRADGSQPTPPRKRATILVVEDMTAVRVAVCGLLGGLGYAVHGVSSAPEALAYLDSGAAIDLLLTDDELEGPSGRDLARELLRRRPGTAVLFMSGCADMDVRQPGGAPGPRLLLKPFSVTDLGDAIDAALAARRA